MDSTTKETLKDHYPSNSKNQKTPQKGEKQVSKVVTGEVRKQKRPFMKRMSDTFLEDTSSTVGLYIVHDVLIPAGKNMICDIIGWGGFAEMLLFGDRRGSRTQRQGGRSTINYNALGNASYRGGASDKNRAPQQREMTRVGRSRHDFDEIVLETRGEAEEVLSHLFDFTIDYGQATVADLYDLVGITGEFTDNKFGWTDLKDSHVSRAPRGGYVINLPRTQQLD